MNVRIAVAKVPKFGLSESGDTVEVIERPRGGLSAIMADGQSHGRAAKRVSQLVVAKAVQLIGDGVRDGAVARGVHDHLYAVRDGKVSTELTMVSVDFRTKSLVITRNTHVPVFFRTAGGEVQQLKELVEPIGIRELMKPVITEVPLEPGCIVLAFTDGVLAAGGRYNQQLDLAAIEAMVAAADPADVQILVDHLLEKALALDQQHPADDMAVLAVGLVPKSEDEHVRRMFISMPFIGVRV
jgi:serine phosphatase RsbU (regulator of sigma subunit)